MMAAAVYILCMLTSMACVVLLFRGYCRKRSRFLLWSSFCFLGLAANNAVLIVDKLLFPDTNLSSIRSTFALAGLLLLIYGLIWDTRQNSGPLP